MSPSAEGWVPKQQCSEARFGEGIGLLLESTDGLITLTGCLLRGEDPIYGRI